MGIEKAWSVTKGRGVVVGLLDSGVDATHPDLKDALVPGADMVGSRTSGNGEKAADGDPHGTNMAGFIAGRGHDGVGMLGAAPEAKVMSVSYSNSSGPDVERGLRYLVDHGAKVINMSFGGTGVTNTDIAYAQSHDVVLVAATGNSGLPPDNPSSQFGVVSVGGVIKGLRTIASDSNVGPPELNNDLKWSSDATQGTAVAGPFSTVDGQLDMVSLTSVAKGTYSLTSGTSNAAAVVSGIVALIRAAHPSMNAANVVNLLIRTASFGKSDQVNDKIGFGVPDAYAAVTSTSVKSVCESPLGSQATKSVGFWPVLLSKSYKYKPACESSGSSSPTASTSGATSTGGSVPTSAASSDSAASSKSGSSGGVPVWVIVLIVVVVLGAIALALVLRSRGKRGGPGGPPSGPPGGGWGPPPGSGPYGGPPPQGPPPGGWQPGPPPQPGWQPGS